ncbi:Na/Pi cotransporter family protein [Peptoniphilus sp. KCTC 25270]|uniref:Na/Pi cotransporter family protein n=1 Tax=Peptoniphilus sp. KCTC 25270 TaxID=2897414 RepID=UPI001E379038|nr:Na/Pi cotransporter family protein [Peptoniphilus sp. KCTC 25270]MCD1147679.1 Na/Pi cotransporter family protein [Peptoniphilus sp. KCTC 25270]
MESTLTLSQIDWHLIAGGLGLFLFGIKLMGDSLTNFAGTKIRDYIEKYTSNPIMGVLVGIIITGLIQSSSGTTVIVISLVRAGLMRLNQAIGITLGANIGTTVTSILIGFNLNYYSYFLLLLGVGVFMVATKKKTSYLGEIVIGFGLLFIGLNIMGDALKELQYVAGFENLVIRMSEQPVIAAIAGTIMTGVIQSSSAVVGIVQTLYNSGAIDLPASMGLVFGANIGTTVTAALAAFGGSLAGKRTSMFHVLFNVTTSVVFLILIRPYVGVVQTISTALGLNNMMTIAVGHFLFNFIGMLLFLPFIKQCVDILYKLMPGKGEVEFDANSVELDEQMIVQFPAGALKQSKLAIQSMSDLALQTVTASKNYLMTGDKKYFKEVNQVEDIINALDTKISSYLMKISKQHLTEELSEEYSVNLQVAKNFERIADLAQNLVEYYEGVFDANEKFDEDALRELEQVYDLLTHIYVNSAEVYVTGNVSLFEVVKEDENALNLMEHNMRASHLRRLTERHQQATVLTSVFVDILGTMERIGDHAFNIGRLTFNPIKMHNEKTNKSDKSL